MRKGLIFIIAILAVTALAVFATEELTVWQLLENEWVALDMNSTSTTAKAFKSGAANGSCDKFNWTINFETEVQVAQWVNWQIDGTKWTWYVRKPGTYITDCISFLIQSNGEIVISFSDFASPTFVPGADPFDTAVNEYINAWYAYGIGNLPSGIEEMAAAAEMNETTVFIPDSAELHEGISRKLWNMIQVVECNSAGVYRDSGVITITLQRQMPWIDGETGNYNF
ncbi:MULTISPECIES: hypothetical protein [Pseudothermotoga]|jgi:hypothetical protein|uniref:Uncharacterized protein n=1 Tax=Pseudothermotoga lettingae (strain ATCC BAA-301 / DSM 14385 / NBRC 107922 / TMO) TaxID=416591 RepID=A8F8F5_PSELT|nr:MULTISPECIES: hypothetical protein [Pseudothermotoga]ABV34439.1 hypothetical protein Tlet_1885 [Pseudothermotoga lettingae TMO]GLI48616.1 hypothetical protein PLETTINGATMO_07850 [Pseudothermotoga lettingae TMO]